MMRSLTPQIPSPTEKGKQREIAYSRLPFPIWEGAGGWAVPLALLAVFVILTLLVVRGATDRVDDALLRWVQAHLLPHVGWFWEFVSWPGYAPQSYGMALLFALLGGWYGGRRGLVLMFLAMLASPVGSVVKHFVDRPRPTPEQVQVIGHISTSASYPSGHVLSYTALCGLLIVLVRAASPAGAWGRRTDGALCGILGALIVLIGPSRVALGHHWPADALGAYLLGGVLLALLACRRRAPMPLAGASEAPE